MRTRKGRALKVEANGEVCAAAGQCLLAAPNVFDQSDKDGTVVVISTDPPESERSAVLEAVNRCPTSAIRIVED
jgi:ferredoxin